MKKVLVFGTFDGFHPGHLSFLKQAKRYGDYLVVVVAKNKTVKKVKHHFPIRDEIERAKALRDCKLANEVKVGCPGNPFKIIQEIKPDVICFGYDQKSFTENLPAKLKEMGVKTKVYRLKPYKPEKYHSSLINPALF